MLRSEHRLRRQQWIDGAAMVPCHSTQAYSRHLCPSPVDLRAIRANLPFYNCVQQSSILEFGATRRPRMAACKQGEVTMKLARLMCSAAIGALAMAGLSSAAFAAAGDECVKVLGYEWSGEKQSMDPADMHSGDDAYHTFAVYNRLVDIDDNFNVLPELATEWNVSDGS